MASFCKDLDAVGFKTTLRGADWAAEGWEAMFGFALPGPRGTRWAAGLTFPASSLPLPLTLPATSYECVRRVSALSSNYGF